MKIKLYKQGIKLPTKSHKSDVGYDVYCPESFVIGSLETITLGLGFGIQVPKGYSCMLVPRSSTAKKGLISQTQIIDPGYTGEIHLILTNSSYESYSVDKDDRLVSLVFYKVLRNQKWTIVNEMKKTERGQNGLGSTGN